MNNKGQVTIYISLILSVIFLLIFSALEITRIHMGKVKISACVHSMQSSIMADYNSILFERYHLMFMDPGYGTGSIAIAEEKMKDYLEISLNGEENDKGLYDFSLEEISITGEKDILAENMQQVKNQIVDYEKAAGLIDRTKKLIDESKKDNTDISKASWETEVNGIENKSNEEKSLESDEEKSIENGKSNKDRENTDIKVEDPRDKLKDCLKYGILNFVVSNEEISKKEYDFSDSPSSMYSTEQEKEKDFNFGDINILKSFLKESEVEDTYGGLMEASALVNYVLCHFSNQVNSLKDTSLKCEVEYILKGKKSDYENLEAVVNEISWMRMPVNYAYLLTDSEKKAEALTLAATICTATGTVEMIEVVKYLLLGCWSYGETLDEMRDLLDGKKIAYVKTKENWNTDLKNLAVSGTKKEETMGLNYEDYLMILLAKKHGRKADGCYARMLDIIELNIKKEYTNFKLSDCIGEMRIQGKICINSLFMRKREESIYEYYFDKKITY